MKYYSTARIVAKNLTHRVFFITFPGSPYVQVCGFICCYGNKDSNIQVYL